MKPSRIPTLGNNGMMTRSRIASTRLSKLMLSILVSSVVSTCVVLILISLVEKVHMRNPLLDPNSVLESPPSAHGTSTKKRFKLELKAPFFPARDTDASHGWELLPGNVVVHRGIAPNPHRSFYVLNPAGRLCSTLNRDKVSLLVFIESDASHGERRQAIRDTWAQRMLQQALNFRIIFVLGVARKTKVHSSSTVSPQDDILKEHYAYGDIVQDNFTESFRNLGRKTVTGLRWASTYCSHAQFVMKTDDDILIHSVNLMDTLAWQAKEGALLCHKNPSRQIVRATSSKTDIALVKYRVAIEDLPGSFFPEYCGGFGYVMTSDVVSSLLKTAETTPYFFIEDVYVTGFCREKAGVNLVELPGVRLRPEVTEEQAPCVFSFGDGRVTSHEVGNPQEFRRLWAAVNTQGFFCPVLLGLRNDVTS